MKERLYYMLGLVLLTLALAYGIVTTQRVLHLKWEWRRCEAKMEMAGDQCIMIRHHYGESVEFIRNGGQ